MSYTRFIAVIAAFSFISGCSKPEPVNENHQGRLEEGDEKLDQDDSWYDEYTFKADQGWRITLAMDSTEIDSYLHLVDPEGNTIEQNDDVEAGNLNARIETTAPKKGEYTVIANSRSGGEAGAYTLTITAQPAQ